MATFTVGSGGTYASMSNAWSATPSTWTENNVFEIVSDLTEASGLSFSGKTTGAFTLTIRPSATKAFNDNANKLTNALRLNSANGTTITFSAAGPAIDYNSASVATIFENLQIHMTNAGGRLLRFPAGAITFRRCIVRLDGHEFGLSLISGAAGAVTLEANLIYSTVTANDVNLISIDGGSASITARNNDFIMVSGSGTSQEIVTITGGAASTYYNNAFMNFDGVDTAGVGTCTHNAATFTIGFGSNNIDNVIYANQFENVTDAANLDARVKAGADLITAGTAAQQPSGGDIMFQAWDAPSRGCWQRGAAGGSASRARSVWF
jgi:hypothetical protein